jgi:DNA polymerase-3 subunit alpha
MTSRFVHLHNHTEYSLLDGANRIPAMVSRAAELGMDALAISDHGVMFGVMEFFWECRKKGVKPILGVEAYVAPNGHQKKTGREENETYHLLLLARDLEGYRNLCKLSSIAALEGYYYKPRIDHELLKTYGKGLIGTSACLGSEVCQELLEGRYDRAQYIAGQYNEIFGQGNFYIELQDHRLPEQERIREPLLRIAKELKLPLIATNDAHYLCQTDAKPHDVLLCIQTGNMVADEKRMRFETDEFYLKSPEEMHELFKAWPEALDNTLEVAERCNVELGKQTAHMPDPNLPEGESPESYLRKLATENLAKRVKNADERALERLNYELDVIEKTGFAAYFLLVGEFAQFTRQKGIAYGVRGSAAGSLVSYCVGITDVDPLEYDLTFERFLNPERVSMPDIDMDFEDARRDEVIQYVNERFGKDHVAQIVTFGTLGAKAAIKDCGRVQGYSPQETDRICKTIPNLPGMTLDRAISESGEFRRMIESDARVAALVEDAKRVEGIARHSGVHAAGIVISREPLMDLIPLYRGTDGQPVTAFEMGILEKLGLLKMDFLGLSNLTVVSRTVENIRRNAPDSGAAGFDIACIPLDDAKTFEMLGRGETVGVFQLESSGMTRYVAELKPESIGELSAMVALFRPGPMEHIPRYIDTKHGRRTAEYLCEEMRPILESTYGVIVYQDQVLKLVQALAGFSLGKADILRRAMGKKDKDAMGSMKAEFEAGAAEKGIAPAVVGKVWELLLPFAGYAFNKAHAVCYGILAYQTAYLKAHYPVEYMCALLAAYRAKEDRVVAFIEECRRLGIAVLPPDVNRSEMDFAIEGRSVRFGLVAIKGVGQGVAEAVLAERVANGPYRHLFEFAERLKTHGVTRVAVEALVKAGALDSIEPNRRKLIDKIDAAIAFAESSNRSRLAGQDSLFLGDSGEKDSPSYPPLPDAEPLTKAETLALEKEVMGIYVSDHPLRGMERLVEEAATHGCNAIEELDEGTHVKLAGVIAGLRTMITKRTGEKMANFVLEDTRGQAGVIAFAATYAKLKDLITKDRVVRISGVVMHRERPGNGGEKSIEIRLEEIQPLEPTLDMPLGMDPGKMAVLRLSRATKSQIETLRSVLKRYPGEFEVKLEVKAQGATQSVFVPIAIDPSPAFVEEAKSAVPRLNIEVRQGKFDHAAFTADDAPEKLRA